MYLSDASFRSNTSVAIRDTPLFPIFLFGSSKHIFDLLQTGHTLPTRHGIRGLRIQVEIQRYAVQGGWILVYRETCNTCQIGKLQVASQHHIYFVEAGSRFLNRDHLSEYFTRQKDSKLSQLVKDFLVWG